MTTITVDDGSNRVSPAGAVFASAATGKLPRHGESLPKPWESLFTFFAILAETFAASRTYQAATWQSRTSQGGFVSPRRRFAAAILPFAFLIAFAPRVSRADQGDAARARALFDSGTTHYNLREYEPALDDFKNAYRIRKDAVFLFNIAQCYRQIGRPEEAASFYRSFRRESPDAANRAGVDHLIAEMDRAVEQRRAAAPPEVTSPPTKPVTPVVAAPAVVPTAVPESALTVTAPPPHKSLARRPWFWVTMAGVAVVVGAGVAVGVVLGSPHAPSPTLGRVGGP